MARYLPVIFALLGGLLLGASAVFLFKGQLVRSALLANPEMIPEAIELLNKKEALARVASAGGEISTAFPGAVAGNPDGDVTVVKFTDYNCGYCRASLPNVEKLMAADKGVKIVYREMPILSQSSQQAALWALAAAQQGKHRDFHQAMFAAGKVDDNSIRGVAKNIGMDIGKAEAFVSSPEAVNEVKNNLALQQKLGNIGTPTFVIGGRMYEGLQSYDALKKAVDEARAQG